MAITPRGTGTVYTSGGVATTTVTNNVPAGTALDDLIVWHFSGNNITDPTLASGWTVLQSSSTTGIRSCIWYRWATASEPSSYSVTVTSARWCGVMMSYSGVDKTTPLDVAVPTAVAGTTTWTQPAITPVTAGALIVSSPTTLQNVATSSTHSSSNLDAIDVQTTNTATVGSANPCVSLGREAWTSGAFTPVITSSQATTRSLGQTFALRPATGGPAYSDSVALSGVGTLTAGGFGGPFISPVGTPTTVDSGLVAGVTTYTINKPVGVTNGHLLIVTESQQATVVADNTAVWTAMGWSVGIAYTSLTGAVQLACATYYKFASGEPDSYTPTGLTNSRYAVVMRAYSGVDATTPFDVTPTSATNSSAVVTPPAIVPSRNDCMIDAIQANQAASGIDNTTYSTSNMTAVTSETSTRTSTANATVGQAYLLQGGAASFSPNLVPTGTPVKGIAFTIALRPSTTAAFTATPALSGAGTLTAPAVAYHEFTYEEGTIGTDLTTTSTPGVNGVVGTQAQYVATPFTGHGANAARVDSTLPQNSWYRYSDFAGDVHTGSLYWRPDTLMGAVNQIVGFRVPGSGSSGTAIICQIRQGSGATAGKIILFSGASVTHATSTVAFSNNELGRLDWNFYKHGDLVDMTVRIFKGANVEGTTPDDTISATDMGIASGGLAFGTIALGMFSANPAIYTYETLRIWSGTLFWPAPYGVTGLAYTGTATLSGDGSLTSAQVPRPEQTAALSGDGSLTTTAKPTATGTATLSGSGTLGAVGVAVSPGAAALSGIGTLTTTQVVTTIGTATLSGAGTLTTVLVPRPVVTVTLSGSGALTTLQAPRPVVSAALTGTGTLVAAGSVAAAVLSHVVSGIGWTDGTTYSTAVVTGTTNATSVRLKVADDSGITTNIRYTSPVTPDADGYATHTITTISPGGTAYYQAELTGGAVTLAGQIGKATAAPTKGVAASLSLNFGSCQQTTFPGNTAIWSAISTHLAPDFWMHLGDDGYDNNSSTVAADHRADLIAQHVGRPAMAAAGYQTPSLWQRSDHDSGPSDNTPGAYNTADLAARKQIFPYPPLPNPTDGIYFDTWWGKTHIVMLDTRCIGRSLNGATDNSSKTRLGATQKAWLFSKLAEPCDFFILICEAAWVGDGWSAGTAVSGVTTWNLGVDGWVRYTTEQDEIAAQLVAAGLTKKMIYVAGDSHVLGCDTGKNNTHGGFPSAIAAPLDRVTGPDVDGGPYTSGPYWRGTKGSTVSQQFGNLTYDGTTKTAFATGWDVQDLVTPKTSVKIAQDGAALSGSGTLSATGVAASTAFTGTAGFSGSGSLTTTQKPSVPVIASLSGAGTLSTTQKVAPVVTVALSGAGTLSSTQMVTAAGLAVLAGTGTLNALQVYSLTAVEWASSVVSSTGWVNPSNAVGSDDSSFATWTSSTANAVSSPLEVGFGTFTAVPADAQNISVRVRVKGYWS